MSLQTNQPYTNKSDVTDDQIEAFLNTNPHKRQPISSYHPIKGFEDKIIRESKLANKRRRLRSEEQKRISAAIVEKANRQEAV